MRRIKQNSTYVVSFFMVDSADHITGKTGLTVTVQLSKAGASFQNASGTVSEIGYGWYKITLTSSDTDTIGDLAFHCTASGADPTDFVLQVVPYDTQDVPAKVWEFISGIGIDAITLLSRVYRVLVNKMIVTNATGNLVLKAENDEDDIASGNVIDNSTQTIRSKLTWL